MVVPCALLAMARIGISCPLYNFAANELEPTLPRGSIPPETKTLVLNRGTTITGRHAREDRHPEGVITFALPASSALPLAYS